MADLKPTILTAFNHTSEEVKSAASYALGNIALGNLKEYLPFILHEIETQPRRQYLLLHSLKEVIGAQSVSLSGVAVLSQYVPSIWDQLYRHTECAEEGTRYLGTGHPLSLLDLTTTAGMLWPSAWAGCVSCPPRRCCPN